MKKLLLGGLIAILSSCSNGEYKDLKDEADITLIAEKDSVKIYRVYNNGIIVYFTNKGGISAH